MEDVIFVLLAFAWLIYSLYKGKSKKKTREKSVPQTETQSGSERKEKDFETIFREIVGEKEDVVTQNTTKETVNNPSTMQNQQMEAQKSAGFEKHTGMTSVGEDFQFSAEGEIETIEDQIEKQEQEKEKEETIEVIDLWDDEVKTESFHFNPRDAIIYSEIIKRKY